LRDTSRWVYFAARCSSD